MKKEAIGAIAEMLKTQYDLYANEKNFDKRRAFCYDFISQGVFFLKSKEVETPEEWDSLFKKINIKTRKLGQSGKTDYKRLLNEINALQGMLVAKIISALYQEEYVVDEMAEEFIRGVGPSGNILFWRKPIREPSAEELEEKRKEDEKRRLESARVEKEEDEDEE